MHAGARHSFWSYLANSVVIGTLSTIASVLLGTLSAYGFSRFRIAGSKDWLFFVLSTSFMPPLAVVVPVLMMYRQLSLTGTHLGLVLLYTVFNLSLAVWLMKGFLDEIPRAYEEAALIDGYSRWDAFRKIIVPQARTGMAAASGHTRTRLSAGHHHPAGEPSGRAGECRAKRCRQIRVEVSRRLRQRRDMGHGVPSLVEPVAKGVADGLFPGGCSGIAESQELVARGSRRQPEPVEVTTHIVRERSRGRPHGRDHRVELHARTRSARCCKSPRACATTDRLGPDSMSVCWSAHSHAT